MVIIGIDSGKTGGVARMHPGGIEVHDTPVLKVPGTNRREYDEPGMRKLLVELAGELTRDWAVLLAIEESHPMPLQAVGATWAQAMGIGLWKGIAVGLQMPFTMVHPNKWQNALMGKGKAGKEGTYQFISRLYPWIAPALKTQRGRLLDGPCDALCIAEWARRESGGAFSPTAPASPPAAPVG